MALTRYGLLPFYFGMTTMGMTTIQIQARLAWLARKNTRGVWIGVCDALGLTLEAATDSDLKSLIEETHHTLFLDLLEDGELDAFLRDRGWQAMGPLPTHFPDGGVRFDVPYEVREALI